MAKEKVVGSMSDWSGMLKDFFRQIDDGSITREILQTFLEHRNPFGLENVSSFLRDWEKFYRGVFGIAVDLSGVKIPEREKGYDRLIVVAQGMTPQRLYDKCKELFLSWKYTREDLDKIVQSERTAENGAYAIWFRDTVEADEDLKNLSADDLKNKGISGITLEERFLMELKYSQETKKHLDIKNVTLCAGSRYSGGRVPRVDWYSDRLDVGWYDPSDRFGHLRSRRAVL